MLREQWGTVDPWEARESLKQQWEYMILAADIVGVPSTAKTLWTEREGNKTCAQRIRQLGVDGWELVSVTPVTGIGGGTSELVFTFKRAM